MTAQPITDPDEARPPLTKAEKNHTPYADTDEVKSFAAGLSEGYLQCRDIGHVWKFRTGGELHDEKDRIVGWFRTFRCPTCKSEREQKMDERGLILGGSYKYPDGYLLTGLGRIVGEGRGALRLEAIKRVVGN